jgi:GT2 family glycosyltransferase
LPTQATLVTPNMMIERLLIQNLIYIPALIFKRESTLKVNGLDEKIWYTADWDFCLKITALGSIIYCLEVLSAFCIHSYSQNIVRSSYLEVFKRI